MTRKLSFVLGIVLLAITSRPVLAHHGGAAFDQTKQQTLQGTVTMLDFVNPHVVSLLLDQGVQHTLTYPNQFNLGASYKPIAPLLLTFGWTWERFHVYQQDLFVGDHGVTVVVPRNYKNGYTLRFGAEYQAIPKLKVRAGFLRDTSPSRPETLSPTLPDGDVWAVSVGAGYELMPGLEVNGGYFHAFYDTVSTPPGADAFPAIYDTRANIYALNVTWKMGAAK